MGLFDLFKKAKNSRFSPDFSETEYDNWLDFLSLGGTSEEWEALKSANRWKFKKDPVETFERYQREVKQFSTPYYNYFDIIKKNWSVMFQSKDYHGEIAKIIEADCIDAIGYYKKMKQVDEKYGEKTPTNIPPYERLALLYERQKRYEDCISVCKEAYQYGMCMTGRMCAAIKKAGRTPTAEEAAMIESDIIF